MIRARDPETGRITSSPQPSLDDLSVCIHGHADVRVFEWRGKLKRVCRVCRRTRNGSKVRHRPERDRFWERVVRDPDTECWEWTGKRNADGRPVFLSDAGEMYAYRFLAGYPDEMHFHHTCENPGCVNPSHGKPLTPSAHRKLHWSLRS